MPTGIYIHIPFCKSRCIYCDFYSTTLPASWQLPYVEAIGREMQLRAPLPNSVDTLYIGGGTPSRLTAEALQCLFHRLGVLSLSPQAEVTIEANPDDVTPEWVALLKQTPVNRISMGVQSLDDSILRTLRRRHTAEQAQQAVALLQDSGYTNLSLDLIYGLPGQSPAQFESDVRRLLGLGIPHLSAYALQYEEGTPLWQMLRQEEVKEADEELSLACYESLIDLTAEAGFEHYEISNFARPGYRSRHNASYWQGTPYIGLGAAAHSYDGLRTRSSNPSDLRAYIKAIQAGTLPLTSETLTDGERYDERIMLSLRTAQGIDLRQLQHDFGPSRRQYCERMARPHLLRGTLQRTTDETLRLTRRGLFISDSIISDLME